MSEDKSWYVLTCPACKSMYDSRFGHSCSISTVIPISTEAERLLGEILSSMREAVRLLKEIEYHTRTR